ncbi:MAG: hypothetical protein UX53_C0004G0027 [Candidatus Azambacteria bacterium GW2011_GWB2_46_37]|uniref:Uncharacterized protein n=1 Tax=Candidatus Azambacteria bacterium GW2011_GWB2_46_37 TaxID=1618618 RepID=A0A0G1Q376_9BACT|nr:MAG: hypothetical protein UX53_C0004G0027 [Candidatus Azambacteria bacterium GW2011_GWB2_46_37]
MRLFNILNIPRRFKVFNGGDVGKRRNQSVLTGAGKIVQMQILMNNYVNFLTERHFCEIDRDYRGRMRKYVFLPEVITERSTGADVYPIYRHPLFGNRKFNIYNRLKWFG